MAFLTALQVQNVGPSGIQSVRYRNAPVLNEMMDAGIPMPVASACFDADVQLCT
jgi:hypothetical protein